MIVSKWVQHFLIAGCVALSLGVPGKAVHAQTGYTAPDSSYRFDYPQRWMVEAQGESVRLTAPDGTRFTLQKDTLTSLSTGSPLNDAELKDNAAKLIAPVLKNAEFVRAQSLSMDHGQGASFRFRSKKSGDDTTADVWVGIIGKHSVVLLPEKAGQPSQTIGLSVIFQSLSFADALPKPPPPRPMPPTNPGIPNTPGTGGASTVSYTRQIAPILQNRCRSCHNSSSASGGLDVTSYSAFLRGGGSGACIVPGKPGGSTLLDYLTGKRDQMPRGSQPLSDAQIVLFRRWIAGGAQDDSAGGRAAGETMTPGSRNRVNGLNGAGQGKRPQPGAMRGNASNPSSRATLLEGYSGHLTQNDLSFTLTLLRDGSATAVWAFSAQQEAHFSGTYAGHDGTYFVTLTLTSGSTPYTLKTLTLDMRSVGDTEVGRFGMDATTPNRKIMQLELTEVGGSSRQPGTGAGGVRRPGGKKGK